MENKNFKNSTIMKIKINFQAKLLLITLLTVSLQLLTSNVFSQNVGINSTGDMPNDKALLDLDASPSNDKGLLVPRLTTANRDAITAPIPESLLIYNTTTQCFEAWNGTTWVAFGCIGSEPFECGTSTVTFTYNGVEVIYGTVVGQNNTCWLDRNLGASQVATSSTDANGYGDLFQWGRLDDGHQVRTSSTTSTLSSTDNPGHGNFITNSSSPYDWRNPQNDNLWQGLNGTNNPCPSGYRLPTAAEWDAERNSWSSNNAAGAFASPLKLPVAGRRSYSNGSLSNVGSYGTYWSSTIDGTNSRLLHFGSSGDGLSSYSRANGFSVRCLKD